MSVAMIAVRLASQPRFNSFERTQNASEANDPQRLDR